MVMTCTVFGFLIIDLYLIVIKQKFLQRFNVYRFIADKCAVNTACLG